VSRELRVGLVGCGRLAERGYLPASHRASGVRLVALADLEPARCARIASHLPAFRSARDLLSEIEVDALIVATPAAAHVNDARAAVDRGVSALVEKPPAEDAVGAAELAALSPPPWVGFNRRFRLEALRAALPPEGPLDLRLGFWTRADAWRPHVVRDDLLLDLGPHLVDLALWLAGRDAIRVRARLAASRAALDVETDRGISRIRCRGDRHYAEWVEARPGGGRPVRHRSGGVAATVAALLRRRSEQPLLASLTAQLEAFARAVRGEDPGPLATAQDGLRVMAVLDGARRSASDDGRWHAIAAPVR
jgi:predicted dehydrogenase